MFSFVWTSTRWWTTASGLRSRQWSETRESEASQDSHNSIRYVINFEKHGEVQVSEQISTDPNGSPNLSQRIPTEQVLTGDEAEWEHYDENISAVSPEDVGNGLRVIFEPVVPGFHNFMPADRTKTSKRPNPGPPNPSSPKPLTSTCSVMISVPVFKNQSSLHLNIPSDSDNKRTNVVTCEHSGRMRLQLTIPPASQINTEWAHISALLYFFSCQCPPINHYGVSHACSPKNLGNNCVRPLNPNRSLSAVYFPRTEGAFDILRKISGFFLKKRHCEWPYLHLVPVDGLRPRECRVPMRVSAERE